MGTVKPTLLISNLVQSKTKKSKTASSNICSPDYNCRLNQKTKQKIQYYLEDIDNGFSFNNCKDECIETFGDKKTKEQKCECYCSMFHDPCPTGKHTIPS